MAFAPIRKDISSKVKYPYTFLNAPLEFNAILRDLWTPANLGKGDHINSTIGPTGSAKSTTDLYLAYLIDIDIKTDEHRFNIDKYCFHPGDFIQTITHPEYPGQAVIFDEIELDANAREFHRKETQTFAKLFSTVRFKRNIIFFSLPMESQLDKTIRRLRKSVIDCKYIDYETSTNWWKYSNIYYSQFADTTKNQEPKRLFPLVYKKASDYPDCQTYKTAICTDYSFKFPKNKRLLNLINQYEKKKNDYLIPKFEEFMKVFSGSKDKEHKKSLYDYMNLIDKNKEDYIDPITNKVSSLYIAKQFDISTAKAQLILKELGKKDEGIDVLKKNKKKKLSKIEL
jgi:hypothetical protein